MAIKDVIKTGVYQNLAGGTGLSATEVIITLFMSCVVGLYIFLVYRSASKSALYSKDTGITIAGMPVVIAAIMVAMQSNLIVSLGMVGALSIVRFRNAVKNPLDILYLFWTISAGIICGVGLKILALVLCCAMTTIILIFNFIPTTKASAVLVLRANLEDVNWEEIDKVINLHSKYCKEKSRSIRQGDVEVIYELKSTEKEELIEKLGSYDFQQINYLEHDGEYRI